MAQLRPNNDSRGAWLAVAGWIGAIYLAVPFARSFQAWLGCFCDRAIFLWAVIFALGLGTGYALIRLFRERRTIKTTRLPWIIGVAGVFLWNAWQLRANPEESFHYFEYGLLGLLVFWALSRRCRDPLIYLLAVLIALLVGTGDEILQWLTPGRFFDARDIGFNALASALIQIGIAGGFRPAFVQWPIDPRSVRWGCGLAAAQVLLSALCLFNTPQRVQLYASRIPSLSYLQFKENGMSEYGCRHFDPETGFFYSRFTLAELKTLDARRATEAAELLDRFHDPRKYGEFLRTYTPITDPFLHEIRVHLYRRDHYLHLISKTPAQDASFSYGHLAAFRENRIAEKYFPETLKQSHYSLKSNVVDSLRRKMDATIYVSAVSAGLITRLNEVQVGFLLAVLMGIIGVVYWRYGRKNRVHD
ncbi:MAG TPA: hypothetical protein DCZ95_14710 [Verrucomicrobia bacterium]|nr:MAG: hypothetical protein A2X46_18185 [Lentisphaerae bacterium GWF2_57_35]HBA85335.1 hypothetical protein [Verrucomicrobiota bacterium]